MPQVLRSFLFGVGCELNGRQGVEGPDRFGELHLDVVLTDQDLGKEELIQQTSHDVAAPAVRLVQVERHKRNPRNARVSDINSEAVRTRARVSIKRLNELLPGVDPSSWTPDPGRCSRGRSPGWV